MCSLPLLLLLVISQASDEDPDLRCGSYCLYVSLKSLDFPVGSFEEIEEKIGQPQAIGYSLAQIAEVARSYGAHTLGVQTSIENLRRRPGRFACIARIDEAHFVNVAKIDEGRATIVDPPRTYPMTLEQLRSRWDGKALFISPEPLLPEEELTSRLPIWAALGVGGGVLVVGVGISLLRGRRTRTTSRNPMPPRFFLFAVASLLIVSQGCDRAPQPTGPPQIYFPEPERNLGQVPVDTQKGYSISFAFKNRGLSPLRIERTVSSCGCAAAHVTKVLSEPDEEGEVTVRILPSVAESRKAYVDVFSNDPVNPLIKLRFSWRSVAPLEFHPPRVDFGSVRPGEIAERTLDILKRKNDRSQPPCEIESAHSSISDHLTPLWMDESGLEVEGPDAKKLRVRLAAGEESGEVTGFVVVQLTHCWNPTIRIPVRWRVQDVVEAAPSSLVLATGSPQETRSATVVVSALAEEDLEVERAELIRGEEVTQAQWEQLAPGRVLVHVEMKLPEEAGLCQSELKVVCRKPISKTLTVPIAAFVTSDDS